MLCVPAALPSVTFECGNLDIENNTHKENAREMHMACANIRVALYVFCCIYTFNMAVLHEEMCVAAAERRCCTPNFRHVFGEKRGATIIIIQHEAANPHPHCV